MVWAPWEGPGAVTEPESREEGRGCHQSPSGSLPRWTSSVVHPTEDGLGQGTVSGQGSQFQELRSLVLSVWEDHLVYSDRSLGLFNQNISTCLLE